MFSNSGDDASSFLVQGEFSLFVLGFGLAAPSSCGPD